MALVLGTNCGFVTVAPVADPAVTGTGFTNQSFATRDVSPVGAGKVVEIGWWCDGGAVDANFEVGIYDHSVGDNEPENLLAGADLTNARGAGSGEWKRVTGLNIAITPETIYWIGVQHDTSSGNATNRGVVAGSRLAIKGAQASLPNPWGTSDAFINDWAYAFYAVWEEAPPGTNMKINISDVFKDIESLKINIGDAWKNVIKVQQNIGDVWKDVFG